MLGSVRFVLSGVCAVVHEQELNVLGVLDEEDLVTGGDHVLRLLVAAVSNLPSESSISIPSKMSIAMASYFATAQIAGVVCSSGKTDLWHSSLAREPSTDTTVDTLGLAP